MFYGQSQHIALHLKLSLDTDKVTDHHFRCQKCSMLTLAAWNTACKYCHTAVCWLIIKSISLSHTLHCVQTGEHIIHLFSPPW